MSKSVLLLNNSYEPITFISERRAWKLIYRDRVNIIDSWKDYYIILNGKKIWNSSILQLKDYQHIPSHHLFYSKEAVIRRDNFTCQYCSMPLSRSEITIDHVLPKSKGGKNSFFNCVVACCYCNNIKGSSTLEECGLKLKRQPTLPTKVFITNPTSHWNENWNDYM